MVLGFGVVRVTGLAVVTIKQLTTGYLTGCVVVRHSEHKRTGKHMVTVTGYLADSNVTTVTKLVDNLANYLVGSAERPPNHHERLEIHR